MVCFYDIVFGHGFESETISWDIYNINIINILVNNKSPPLLLWWLMYNPCKLDWNFFHSYVQSDKMNSIQISGDIFSFLLLRLKDTNINLDAYLPYFLFLIIDR